MPETEGIPCLLMRGGTSKGALFLASDLPQDPTERDDLLLRIMGSPDPRQVDGLGGAHPLTSKVAVISPSPDTGADVDYLFLQVGVDTALVSSRQNCGNILAAVGPFAVERGLVQPSDGHTEVRIRMVNTGSTATARFATPGAVVDYDGGPAAGCAVAIDGVPGTAAPIRLTFEATAGSSTGALFPTGKVLDHAEEVDITCVDNGMPSVLMRAADLGLTGDETPADLEANEGLAERLAGLRLAAAELMGMGDVRGATVPKLVLLAPPRAGGSIATRSFLPVRVHTSIGVLGALTVAAGVLAEGSVGHDLAALPAPDDPFRVEHPTGHFDVEVALEATPDGYTVSHSTALRTARKIFDGRVFPRPHL
ncbi:4-oxalomesaconate tautomerase [Pseudarthrobacter defluvii]|uniref:4-oxalomesaconate tautomerase n=1 Tax=Pseudarthrobacter defluvii TaxID=410837 RepID=UPI00278606C6|nr:4-oxalomesaconate tautomerase [Pseudarthrobacter defluvii]MDQ0771387.1 4-oxalomesaconate tautomerase [Pseudarthrobacter defluvii]